MSDVVLDLPRALRAELKEPLGPLFTDAEALLEAAAEPLVSVGDIVTYHLLEAGHTPAVALVDDRTKRTEVDRRVSETIGVRRSGETSEDDRRESAGGFDRRVDVENPPATITDDLLRALREGIDDGGTTCIVVDGEEDLAALPAVLAVPAGASVVYGQPDEGMVLVTADDAARKRARSLLERMDGDVEAALSLLE